MSIYSSKRKSSRRQSKTHLGHLKLSVIEESSALVVNIFEARGLHRGLHRKDNGALDTYVKIYLNPDPDKSTKVKTKIVKQKDPVFNEKFSFILSEDDQDKQLYISVWAHQSTSRNVMLGCMTFNVKDLLGTNNKGLNGWYQVLDEAKGRSESMLVPTSISKSEASLSKYETTALRQKKTFAVTIMKGEKGYGFSVYYYNPVYVTQATKGLPAANADIRVNDVILEVEETDVTRANGQQVVEMIRKCPTIIHMIIQRDLSKPKPSERRTNLFPNQFNSLSRSRSKSYMSVSSGNHSKEAELLVPAAAGRRKRHSAHYHESHTHSQLVPEYHHDAYKVGLISPHHMSQGAPLAHPTTAGGYSVMSQPTPIYGAQDGTGMYPPPPVHAYGNGNGTQGDKPISYGTSAVHSSGRIFRNKSMQSKEFSPREGGSNYGNELGEGRDLFLMSQPEKLPPHQHRGRGGGSMRYHAPSLSQGVGGGDEIYPLRNGQQSLSQYDKEAVSLMRSASLLPSPRHIIETRVTAPFTRGSGGGGGGGDLSFSGVGKDSAIATTITTTTRTSQSPSSPSHSENDEMPVQWESLSTLEQKRQKAITHLLLAEMSLCQQFGTGIETYVRPLQTILPKNSHKEIFLAIPELYAFSVETTEELKLRQRCYRTEVPSVTHYVYNIADIYAAKLPEKVEVMKTYMNNSHSARQEIALCFTNEGFTRLVQESVQGESNKTASIYSFVEAGKEYLKMLTKWMMALLYLTPLYHPDQNYLTSIVQALIPLTADKELVKKFERDQEIMKNKLLCVGFGAKITPFQLSTPGRFLIQEGEVTVVEKKRKKKLWLMLFTDILLLTRQNGKIFTCMEEPIVLENLTITAINCTEPTEFQLVVVEGSLNRLIRASSVSAKEEWVEMLKERASGTLANRKRIGENPHLRTYRLQESMKKQSKLAATLAVDEGGEVTTATAMSPIPELAPATTKVGKKVTINEGGEGGTASKGEGKAAKNNSVDGGQDLKRGVSKRRSLFSVGKKASSASAHSSGSRGKGKGKEKEKEKDKDKDKKKTRSLSNLHSISPQGTININQVPVELLRGWEASFNSLLKHPDGILLFEEFLISEFSEENIQFWRACEKYSTTPDHMIQKEADIIYEEYVAPQAPKLVNIDHQTTQEIIESMKKPDKSTFQQAQQSIYLLMARDSFVRFVKAESFQQATKRGGIHPSKSTTS